MKKTFRAIALARPEQRDFSLWFWAGLLALALVAWSGAAHAKAAPETFSGLAKKLLPKVVNISTTQKVEGRAGPELPQLPPGSPFEEFFKDFFERNQPQERSRRATSLGSGFIVSDEGHVVTNNHVIQDAEEITVILHDDTRLPAKLIGRDPKTDLAVLKVESKMKISPIEFGDSDVSEVGDWIIAIGNPFGLGGTVTAGIISARGRDINAGPYDDFLQTDASINRGNSGGPMFNLDGEVIGVNTAIFSPSGGSVGIGFAIPSAVAKPVIRQLIKFGEVKRGWLGVRIQTVTDELAESFGLKKAIGALVASVVEKGPAEKAKIKAGDVIISFNGREVSEMRRLPRMVAETEVGSAVPVEVWRDRKKVKLSVEIGELEDDEKPVEVARRAPGGATKVDDLGLELSAITDKVREKFSLGEDAKGVVVVAVDSAGPAAEKGIRPGDRIVEVSQEAVADPGDIARKVDEAKKAGRKSVLLLLEGQGQMRFVAVKIGKS